MSTVDEHAIVHEVADDERKAFVRGVVHRRMAKLGKKLGKAKPPRSNVDPRTHALNEVLRDSIANTAGGRMLLVLEANFQWQKTQLRDSFGRSLFLAIRT